MEKLKISTGELLFLTSKHAEKYTMLQTQFFVRAGLSKQNLLVGTHLEIIVR